LLVKHGKPSQRELRAIDPVAVCYNQFNQLSARDTTQGSLARLALWERDLIRNFAIEYDIPLHRHPPYVGLSYTHDFNQGDGAPAWRIGLLGKALWAPSHVMELQGGMTSYTKRGRPFLSFIYDPSFRKTWSFYGNLSWMNNRPGASDIDFGCGVSLLLPSYIAEIRPSDFFRRFRIRMGFRIAWDDINESVSLDDLKPEIQVGFHLPAFPFASPYKKIGKEKHKIWEHPNYKVDAPIRIFKKHLFRPRRYPGLGLWVQMEQRTEFYSRPEIKPALIVPAWDVFPFKLDGILEIHLGWKETHHYKLNRLNREKWKLGLYYDRFYVGKPFSWYANVSWINAKTENSKWSVSGGVSITAYGPILNKCVLNKPFNLFHWVKIRFGLRSFIDSRSNQLTKHQLELQLGLSY